MKLAIEVLAKVAVTISASLSVGFGIFLIMLCTTPLMMQRHPALIVIDLFVGGLFLRLGFNQD